MPLFPFDRRSARVVVMAMFCLALVACSAGMRRSDQPTANSPSPEPAVEWNNYTSHEPDSELPEQGGVRPTEPIDALPLGPQPDDGDTDDRDLGDGADHEPLGNPWLRRQAPPRPRIQWPFVDAAQQHTSTFALDPDTASYDRLRRQLADEGELRGLAIRAEELINAMPYRALPADHGELISLSTVTTEAPWGADRRLLMVGVHARQARERAPMNLVFVVDVSGSMRGRPLRLVQQTLRFLAPTLREQDRVSLITYAGATSVVLSQASGADQRQIREAIDDLSAGGGTRADDALEQAYRLAARGHRDGATSLVVMATDGDFNQGRTHGTQLIDLIQRYNRQGILLEVLGIGTDHAADFNLDYITNHADGRYRELIDETDAERLAAAWASDGYQVAGRDAKIQVFFNPQQVAAYRLIGYRNRRLQRHEFNNDQVDGAELMHGSHAVAVYEIIPAATLNGLIDANPFAEAPQPQASVDADAPAALVRLRYRPDHAARSVLLEQPAAVQAVPDAALGDDARLAMAAATLGLLLTESSEFGPRWPHLWEQLDDLQADSRPQVREFIDLAWGSHPYGGDTRRAYRR